MIIEQGKCRITSVNPQGLGEGKTDKGLVELPYTISGELVEFERHRYRRQSNCVLKKVIQEAPARIKPICQYFGACGGCLLQHMNSEAYYEYKYNLIAQALAVSSIQTIIQPIITIPFGQRRRINLEMIKKNDQLYLGFHRLHSNQVINIDECPASLPEISNVIKPLKAALVQFFNNLQKAEIFLTQATNGLDIYIKTEEIIPLTSTRESWLVNFAKENSVIRIILQSQNAKEVVYETATPYIVFDDIKVEINAYSFLQVSFSSDKVLKDLILKYLPLNLANQKIVDLFCGRGTFTLPLSKYFQVDGFENYEEALNALEDAAQNHDLSIELKLRDLFTAPLTLDELNKYNYAIINPPRAGAKEQCKNLSKSKVNKIIYISCNLNSFIRDAKILCQGNYKLIEITPVDQFYWNPHLELVGVFQRL